MLNMDTDKIKIDWGWVRADLLKKERINALTHNTISEYADECLEKAKTLSAEKVISAEKGVVDIGTASVELEGGVIFSGKRLAASLKGSARARLFLVTIGPRLEEEATKLMTGGDQLRGYLLDSIGSIAVESLAENAENALRKEMANESMSVSMRYSPGYCDWPVEEQRIMSEAIGFARADVHLTENCMMSPKKSISFMAGIGPQKLFAKKTSPCGACERNDCDFRRS